MLDVVKDTYIRQVVSQRGCFSLVFEQEKRWHVNLVEHVGCCTRVKLQEASQVYDRFSMHTLRVVGSISCILKVMNEW